VRPLGRRRAACVGFDDVLDTMPDQGRKGDFLFHVPFVHFLDEFIVFVGRMSPAVEPERQRRIRHIVL